MDEPLWDFGSSSDGSQARYKAERLERENQELRGALDRMSLLMKAMWELLAEPQGLHLYMLVKKMNEIDRRDGKADGHVDREVTKCKSCGRAINRRKRKCAYCGYENPRHDPFQIF